LDLDALEDLMATQRAVRHFTDQPVDDALIERLLRLASRAPSARNVQPWRFIVVRNASAKGALGKIFDEIGAAAMGHAAPERMPWQDVPVLIVVFTEASASGGESALTAQAASIYPAVQNLLLGINAAGLGAVLTTRWKGREPEVLPLLGLPDDAAVHAILPVGWPDRKYGRGKRRPVRELTYREKYGQPWAEA
jgi:nitroreductase